MIFFKLATARDFNDLAQLLYLFFFQVKENQTMSDRIPQEAKDERSILTKSFG